MLFFEHYKIELLQHNEAEVFYNLIETNRKRLEDFFAGTVSRTGNLEDTITYCRLIQKRITNKSYLPYLITDTNTNKFIGLIDVKNIDWNVPKAELGSFIDLDYEGKGVTSKATRLVVRHIVETYNFKKLLCRANARNKASIAVILKNGFEFEGTIRRDYKTTKGEIVDLNYYGRLF